jgi:hypothetical protein
MHSIGDTLNGITFMFYENQSGVSGMKRGDTNSMPNPEVQLLSFWERKLAECKRLTSAGCLCV